MNVFHRFKIIVRPARIRSLPDCPGYLIFSSIRHLKPECNYRVSVLYKLARVLRSIIKIHSINKQFPVFSLIERIGERGFRGHFAHILGIQKAVPV